MYFFITSIDFLSLAGALNSILLSSSMSLGFSAKLSRIRMYMAAELPSFVLPQTRVGGVRCE